MKIISKATIINSIIVKRKPHHSIGLSLKKRGLLIGEYAPENDFLTWNRGKLAKLNAEELALIFADLPAMLEIDIRRHET